MYRVYILANQKSQRYIGLTDDVGRRLQQHNEGASKWTKDKGPWSLSWVSGPMSLSEARKLENQLKRQKGGDGLQAILQAHNPAAAGSQVQILPPNHFSNRMCQVYILKNQELERYTGLTGDVERRLRQHNEGASKWTKGKPMPPVAQGLNGAYAGIPVGCIDIASGIAG